MSDKDKFDIEKRNDNHLDYHSPNMSSDWQFSSTSLANAPVNLVPNGNRISVGSYSCSSAPMVNSFGQSIWDHPTNSQNFGFSDIDVQNNAGSSNALGIIKGSSSSLRISIDRPLDIGWNPASSMLKGGIFLPNVPGMYSQSLSQFPADSVFAERTEGFSSFSGGKFSGMMNTFGIPEATKLYSRGWGMKQGPQEVFAGSGLKSVSDGQSQKNEMNVAEVSKDASLFVEHGATDGSMLKNGRGGENLVKSHEEVKQGVVGSINDSDEAELSSGAGQDEPSMLQGSGGEPSSKSHSSNERKRNGQDTDLDQGKGAQLSGEAAKDNTENQQKGDQPPTSTPNKISGKQGKLRSQNSDPPKEEYIHVRARRGWAKNSHSLAERVRREKISERMKFLQGLVPGCSKVTGKAVILDEIINYVQSLQRQVEFLSMKYEAVNPRLDFNIEGLLARDMLQSRAGPSSTWGFSPDMPMACPPLHQSQPGLIHAGLPGMGSPADIHRRTINSQLTPMTRGFKEPTQDSRSSSESFVSIDEDLMIQNVGMIFINETNRDCTMVTENETIDARAANWANNLNSDQRDDSNDRDQEKPLDVKFTNKWVRLTVAMAFTALLSLLSLSYILNNGEIQLETLFKQNLFSYILFLMVLMVAFFFAINGVIFSGKHPTISWGFCVVALTGVILSFTILLRVLLPPEFRWVLWIFFIFTFGSLLYLCVLHRQRNLKGPDYLEYLLV